jgi:class 3 adenylate cyclase
VSAFLDDLDKAVAAITGTAFTERDGRIVPETGKVGYDEAVKLDGTWLYCDLLDSSGLVAASGKPTVGKVIRLFLDSTVRIMRQNGGEIRSFDGDRVMAIFVGDGRFDTAVKTAMQVKWACNTLLQPAIEKKYPSLVKADWKVRPASGIASGETLIVRGGVRKLDNDLVSIGVAPNLAAKLSDVRNETNVRHVRIDAATYKGLTDKGRLSDKKTDMWSTEYSLEMGGKKHAYRRSSATWSIT